jgi:hypothetical protein
MPIELRPPVGLVWRDHQLGSRVAGAGEPLPDGGLDAADDNAVRELRAKGDLLGLGFGRG